MDEYGSETYGERWADVYDDWVGARLGPEVTGASVECLAELASGGNVLELAIGTGRVALPLAERGLEVHGIDASEAMVAKLREKPGGDAIPVTISDFADVGVEGEFALIFIVFNTLFGLTSQEEQIRCFRNVAGRLSADGVFVVEAFVPDVTRFEDGQTVRAVRAEADHVEFEVSQHDLAAQTVHSQHVVITEEGTRLLPVHLRYAWPSELDLMARLAGLRLRDRWGGWDRSPFTSASGTHVSVYARDH
ncbi:MAG: class I SAM-dependent DNA methyltransferase [Egibacteraceae bacterium]